MTIARNVLFIVFSLGCLQILQEYSIVPNEVQKFSAVEKKEFQVLHKAKIDGIKDQMARYVIRHGCHLTFCWQAIKPFNFRYHIVIMVQYYNSNRFEKGVVG